MANTYLAWKGAAEPAETSPSGNEYKAWKGSVEPIGAGTSGKVVNAGPAVALAITTYPATLAGTRVVDVDPAVALAITTYPVSLDRTVNGSSAALTITTHKATLSGATVITAGPAVALTITTYPADIAARAALGGTIADVAESVVVASGGTLTIELTHDTWIAAGAGPIGTIVQSDSIVDGITSAQVEAGGWNAQIRDVLDYTDLARTSATVATLTVPATAGYDITSTEVITATIPNAVLTEATVDLVSSATSIRVDVAAGGAGGVTRGVVRSVIRGVTS